MRASGNSLHPAATRQCVTTALTLPATETICASPVQLQQPVTMAPECESSMHAPLNSSDFIQSTTEQGGSVAEWLACWTQAQKALVRIAVATLSDNSLRQTVHTHCASVHRAAKLVAALLRVAGVTADLAESNGSLPPGL